MKRVLRILGVVALLVAAVSVTAANNAKKAPKTLVVDVVRTFHAHPGVIPEPDKGALYFSEMDVYVGGTFGTADQELIGEGKWSGVHTEVGGLSGFWESMTIHIDGRGVIEGLDTGAGSSWKGAIIGGTDDFAGASGEYSGIFIGPPQHSRITFTFKK